MLKPEEIGLMRILYSSAILIGTIFPLGLNGAIIKFLPKYRNASTGHQGFLGSILLISLPVYLAIAMLLWVFKQEVISHYSSGSPLFVEYFDYVLPMSFFIGYANLLSIYLFANFKSVFPSLVNDLFIRLFSTVIISLYFLQLIDANNFFRLYLLGYFLQFVVLFLFSGSTGKFSQILSPGLLQDRSGLKQLIIFSLVMSVVSISNMALKNIDVIMMGSFLSLQDVGIYSIAILVAGFIELPASAMGRIADSNIAQAFQEGKMDTVQKIYTDSTRLLMAVGLILFLLITGSIQDLLIFLPPKYSTGHWVVVIAGLASLSNMATGINSSLLFYTNQVRLGSILLIGLLVLNIILNYFLVPVYGIVGAAWSTAISFVTFNALKFIFIERLFKLNPYGDFVFKIILSGLLAFSIGLCANFLNEPFLRIMIKSILVGSIFTACCFRLGVLPEFEKNLPSGIASILVKKKSL